MRNRFARLPAAVLALAVATGVAACGGGGDGGAMEQETAPDVERQEAMTRSAPDTTAPGLWSHLQEVGYRDAWRLYPDKGELYEGTEPHGILLTTYLNGPAHQAMQKGAASLPTGAVVVKENFKPDSTLAAITVMYKHEGYDPEHNDWFWVKYLPDGSVANDGAAAGRVASCIGCHAGKADNDYIMTGALGGE